MHSSMLREGRRCEVLRDILGHANIDVTQNIFARATPTISRIHSLVSPGLLEFFVREASLPSLFSYLLSNSTTTC